MKNGKKKSYENILLKSIKTLQKDNKKPHKQILKLSIMNNTLTFRIIKLRRERRKKKIMDPIEIPKFVFNNYKRISWALKFISQLIKKGSSKKLYINLKQEILATSINKENLTKIDTHRQVISKKRLFNYYRW